MALKRRPASRKRTSLRARGSGGKARSGEADRTLSIALAVKPALVRDVISRLIGTVPQLRVVGYGEDEGQLREVVGKLRPRVLLFDYEAMGPGAEGVISLLRRSGPDTRILVIARRSSDETVEQVLLAGASGLVGKQEDFETLVRAIQAVAAGELWANRRTAAQALESLTDASPPVLALASLTSRELEIADGVALGLRNKEIAQQMNISEATVKSHLNTIFRKLKIEGRVALAMLALERIQPKN